MARLKDEYASRIVPELEKKLGTTNRMLVPRLQKIVLNMISTVTMIRVGKVYGNLMIDVRATNEKLVERCRNIVMAATGCDHDKADEALKETGNDCRIAIVMILLGLSKEEAEAKLNESDGMIREALK